MPLYGSIILQLEVFPTLLCCLLEALLLMLDKHILDGKFAFVDTNLVWNVCSRRRAGGKEEKKGGRRR